MYIVAAICRSCSHLDTETRLLCSSASSYTLSVSVTSHPAHLINSSYTLSVSVTLHPAHLINSSYTLSVSVTSHPAHLINSSYTLSVSVTSHPAHLINSSYTLSVSVTSHPAHLINSSDFVSFRCFCHLLHLLDLVFSAYLDSMLRTFFLFSTITCNVSCVSCSNSRVFVCIFHHDNDPVLVLLLNRVKIKGVL